MVIGKTKRELVFEELNQMIAYTKRLEFEIKRGLDTPLRMFRILLQRHTQAMRYPTTQASQPYQAVKDAYFVDDIRPDDLAKVMKFANQLLGANPQFKLSQFSVESPVMASLNVSEFIHALQLLELQKNHAITRELL